MNPTTSETETAAKNEPAGEAKVPKRAKAARKVKTRAASSRPKRRRRKLTRRDLLILLIPALAAVIVVAVCLLVTKKASTLELGSNSVQYYAGNTYPVGANASLRRDQNGKTTLEADGATRAPNNLPIYSRDSDTIVLPDDSGYYDPRRGTMSRLDFFSTLRYTGGGVRVEREGEKRTLTGGFVYDGKDLYIFLEPVVLEFNGYTMELGPLSYVEAVYGGMVMAFDYKTKQFLMESPIGGATVTAGGGDYKVSLLGDSMTQSDGTRSLLFTRPELLDPLK